jgi:hypothetical protein
VMVPLPGNGTPGSSARNVEVMMCSQQTRRPQGPMSMYMSVVPA